MQREKERNKDEIERGGRDKKREIKRKSMRKQRQTGRNNEKIDEEAEIEREK